MLSDKVHVLIKSLNAYHVCLCVIRKFYLVSAADALRAPVEISHVYRTTYLACDSVESCFPTLYRLTGSFWCKGEMDCLLCLHLLDDAQDDVTAFLPVDRNAAKLAEEPS